jgi:hypothetical protein
MIALAFPAGEASNHGSQCKDESMGWLTDLLKDYPALAVAKERLAYKEEQFNELKDENRRLTEEIGALKAENAELKKKLADPMQRQEFILESGALWRVKPDGAIEHYPYCTCCHHVLTNIGTHFRCYRCDITTPFGSSSGWTEVLESVEKVLA